MRRSGTVFRMIGFKDAKSTLRILGGYAMEKKDILGHFRIEGEFTSVEAYGSGHINHTFLAKTKEQKKIYFAGNQQYDLS